MEFVLLTITIAVATILLLGSLFILSSKSRSNSLIREAIRFAKFIVSVLFVTLGTTYLLFTLFSRLILSLDLNWTGVLAGPSIAGYMLLVLSGVVLGFAITCYLNYRFNSPMVKN